MNHKKKKSNNEQRQFEFCEVCRLNHNDGRRHNYFPSHKSSLSNLLSRFQSKLSDVKFFLKTPMLILPEHAHQNRIWCVFCNCDVLELDSQFACSNAVEHLASEDHWKRVKAFMWKYGGGMDRVDLFRISEADYAKWEKKCKALKTEATKTNSVETSNNIHDKHNADSVNSSSKNNSDALNSCIPNYVLPLHSYTNERTPFSSSGLSSSISETGPSLYNISGGSQVQEAHHLKNSTGFVDNQHFSNSLANGCSSHVYSINESVYSGVSVNGEIPSGWMNLSQISCTSKVTMEGNVHSGAPPPWLDATKEDNLNSARKQEECGNLAQEKNQEKNSRWRTKQPRRMVINQRCYCRFSLTSVNECVRKQWMVLSTSMSKTGAHGQGNDRCRSPPLSVRQMKDREVSQTLQQKLPLLNQTPLCPGYQSLVVYVFLHLKSNM